MRVAFQGERGAYSEEALVKLFGRKAQPVPMKGFVDVFRAVETGKVESGILPIENSSTGSVWEVYDLLAERKIQIVGEVFLKIRHCLLGRRGSSLNRLRRVVSHPQALEQCREFLEQQAWETEPFFDTAGAARWLAESGPDEVGVLAGALAGEHYGLDVLVADVQSFSHNTTRFVAVAREALAQARGPYKTSLVFETRDVPGALYKALGGFATNGVNLTKLESRPAKTGMGRYRFFLDCEGHAEEPRMDRALRELKFFSVSLRILGSYPKGEIPD